MRKLIILFLLIASNVFSQLEQGKQLGWQWGIKKSALYQYALDFDGSTEYLSCTPALRLTGEYSAVYPSITGDTSFACNQVYGSWTFTVNKAGDTDVMDLYFVNDVNALTGNSGYLFRYGGDEKMYLYSVASGTPTARITSSGTYAINNNHTVIITRNTNGAFTMTANGTSVGTVTNATYTNSNYCFTDFTGTTQLSSLSFQQGEGSLDLNSYERIYHSDNRNMTKTGGYAWTGAGSHSVDTTSTDKRTGTYSSRIISTGTGDSTTNFISLPNTSFDTLKTDANGIYEKYTLEGWARGVGIVNGSEKLTQGDFSNRYKWFSQANFSIDTTIGKATFQDIALANIGQTSANMVNGTFNAGSTYAITFTISDASTYARLNLYNYNGDLLYVALADYVNGTYTKYFIPTSTTTGFSIFGFTAGSSFSIDDISIKLVSSPSITLKVGNQVKTVTGISCVPSTFTKFVFNFQSNALVSNQPILLYINQADTVFIDDVSLTKAYDFLANTFALHGSAGADYLFARGGNNATTNGYNSYINASNNFITAISGGTTQTTETNSATINTSNYYLQSSYYDRIANQINYVNGVASTGTSLSGMGKIINTGTFYIGTLSGTGSDDWNGKIGHIRFIKFTDIAQSNVSALNLVGVYNLGKLQTGTWTGGSPIEVAFYDWKGATTNEILSDKSSMGNNLTGTNIDINDRIKVKGKFK